MIPMRDIFDVIKGKKDEENKEEIFDEFLDHLGRWLKCYKDGSGIEYKKKDFGQLILLRRDTNYEYYIGLDIRLASDDDWEQVEHVHLLRNHISKR